MNKSQVRVSYDKLWKLLIDRKISKSDLRKTTNIAASTFTKMNNEQFISLEVLGRISNELGCGLDDIVEINCNQEVKS